MVKLLAEQAPAKINLFLRVIGRRADGYHELDSVFIPVSLCDRVRLQVRFETQGAASTSITLRCNRDDIPAGEKNLAWRAADGFLRGFSGGIVRPAEIAIDLHKEIPAGAGLGGGSSDAGTVLRMLSATFRLGDDARVRQVGLKLGADVPFFLDPCLAHVGGIGERISPIEEPPGKGLAPLSMVIAVPHVEVPTAEIYRALMPSQWSGPAPEDHLRAIAADRIAPEMLQNDLAAVATARYPEIARLRSALIAAGAKGASMTGSGGAVFGLFGDMEAAAEAAANIRREYPDARVFVAKSLLRRDW